MRAVTSLNVALSCKSYTKCTVTEKRQLFYAITVYNCTGALQISIVTWLQQRESIMALPSVAALPTSAKPSTTLPGMSTLVIKCQEQYMYRKVTVIYYR